MRVHPVRRYSTPRYPTADEATQAPKLLEHVPSTWGSGSRLAAFLGAGLAAQALLGCGSTDGPGQSAPAGTGTGTAPLPADRAARRPESGELFLKVAPLLESALRRDGRGAFGCVVVDPPSFLSEEEALGIIRRELSDAGLKLSGKARSVPGVKCPMTTFCFGPRERTKTHPAAPFEFDDASADGAVVFEYISEKDFAAWLDGKGPQATVVGYNFAELACRLAGELANTPTRKPVLAGVFFDPMARFNEESVPKPQPRTGESVVSEQAWEEYRKQVHAGFVEVAGEKLRSQVRHFVKQLRAEGALPAEAAQPRPAPPPPPAEADPQWLTEARRKLDKKVRFELVQVPVAEALKALGESCDLKFVLGKEVTAGGLPPVTLTLKQVSARHALEWLVRLTKLDYEIRETGVAVSTPEELNPRTTKVTYDLSDLTGGGMTPGRPAPEVSLAGRRDAEDPARLRFWHDWSGEGETTAQGIFDMVKYKVRPASWGVGGCSIEVRGNEVRGNELIVVQRPEAHPEIVRVLAELRAAREPDVEISARFYAVESGKLAEVERAGRLLGETAVSGTNGQQSHALRGRTWPATRSQHETFTGALLDVCPILAPDRRSVTLTAGLGLWLPAGPEGRPLERLRVFRAPLVARVEIDKPLIVPLGVLANQQGGAEPVVTVLRARILPGPPAPEAEPEPAWKAELLRELDKEVSFEFKAQPFEDCLKHLQGLTAVSLITDPTAFSYGGASAKKPVTAKGTKTRLGQALRQVCQANRLDWRLENGAVLLTWPEEVIRRELQIRIYDLREPGLSAMHHGAPQLDDRGAVVPPPPPEKPVSPSDVQPDVPGLQPWHFRESICRAVEPASWGVGGSFMAERTPDLVVAHRPEVLRRISGMIENLRLAVHPEVRLDFELYGLPAGAAVEGAGQVEKQGRLLSRLTTVGLDGQRLFAADCTAWPGGRDRPERLNGAIVEALPKLSNDRQALTVELNVAWLEGGAERPAAARLQRKLPVKPGTAEAVEVGLAGPRKIVLVLKPTVRAERFPEGMKIENPAKP